MRTVSAQLQIARQQLMLNKAMLFFVEIPLRNGSYFRLVRSSRHIVATRNEAGLVFTACGMEIEIPSEDVSGSLGRLVIGVPNVSRLPMTYIEVDDETGEGEILGAEITCWLGLETGPGAATLEDGLSWKHIVLAADASSSVLAIECGYPPAFEKGPRRRYSRAEYPQLLAQRP